MQEVVIGGVENGVLHVALSGDIDLGNAEEFYQAVMAGYKASPADVCFDCAALNFIDLCGIHTAFYDGDEALPGAQLLHAVGFRKNEAGRLEMDLTGFFTAPCQHCKD